MGLGAILVDAKAAPRWSAILREGIDAMSRCDDDFGGNQGPCAKCVARPCCDGSDGRVAAIGRTVDDRECSRVCGGQCVWWS